MENIFMLATRKKLRFNVNGNINVEDLWTVGDDNLINYESQLQSEVDSFVKTARRTAVAKNKQQEDVKLRLAIVTAILDVKDQESEEQSNAKAAKEHNATLDALIAEKQMETLKGKSVEELIAMRK